MIYPGIIISLVLTLGLVACSGDSHLEIAAENTGTITHYAQFRDPQQNRVVLFVFDEKTSAAAIKHHAQSLAHEQIGPWHYAFLSPFEGEPRFTDCLEAPEDVLCRQP